MGLRFRLGLRLVRGVAFAGGWLLDRLQGPGRGRFGFMARFRV